MRERTVFEIPITQCPPRMPHEKRPHRSEREQHDVSRGGNANDQEPPEQQVHYFRRIRRLANERRRAGKLRYLRTGRIGTERGTQEPDEFMGVPRCEVSGRNDYKSEAIQGLGTAGACRRQSSADALKCGDGESRKDNSHGHRKKWASP